MWNKGIEAYTRQQTGLALELCGVAVQLLAHLPTAIQAAYHDKVTDMFSRMSTHGGVLSGVDIAGRSRAMVLS